ncbi:MAG: HAD hydrolase-like protein [Candidatus Omnitrophica bacterium]|nr:HAD hydrolase-like protein [Candidatus Omnitrophota bacterium]
MGKNILIFDFDGTIADSFHHILRISDVLAEEFRFLKVKPEEVEQMKDMNLWQVIEHLRVPIFKVPIILSRAKILVAHGILSIDTVDGLKEVLVKIKDAGIPMGILTSNSPKNVHRFLENHKLNLFDFVNEAFQLWGKNHCIKRLMEEKKFNPADVIYIGDEIRDIEAAQKIRIRSAAVTWGYNSGRALAALKPNYLINTPEDLLQLTRD